MTAERLHQVWRPVEPSEIKKDDVIRVEVPEGPDSTGFIAREYEATEDGDLRAGSITGPVNVFRRTMRPQRDDANREPWVDLTFSPSAWDDERRGKAPAITVRVLGDPPAETIRHARQVLAQHLWPQVESMRVLIFHSDGSHDGEVVDRPLAAEKEPEQQEGNERDTWHEMRDRSDGFYGQTIRRQQVTESMRYALEQAHGGPLTPRETTEWVAMLNGHGIVLVEKSTVAALLGAATRVVGPLVGAARVMLRDMGLVD